MYINMYDGVLDDAPDPPTGLRAVAISSRSIELSWTKSQPKNGQPIVAYAVNYRANRGLLASVVADEKHFRVIAKCKVLMDVTGYIYTHFTTDTIHLNNIMLIPFELQLRMTCLVSQCSGQLCVHCENQFSL